MIKILNRKAAIDWIGVTNPNLPIAHRGVYFDLLSLYIPAEICWDSFLAFKYTNLTGMNKNIFWNMPFIFTSDEAEKFYQFEDWDDLVMDEMVKTLNIPYEFFC